MDHQESGELQQAERLLRRILRVDPQHAEAWYRLGVVEHQRGRTEQAVECLSRAVALDGSRADFHSDLGSACLALGRIIEATESYEQAVQLSPNDPQVHHNLGLVLQRQGNMIGAKLRLQQAVRLRPEFAEAWLNLGNVYQSQGELEHAARSYERYRTLRPTSPDGHYNLGNVRLTQNRLVEAVACYAEALKRKPDCVEALNNLGTVLNRLGKTEEALRSYRLAVELRPAFTEAQNNLGALLSSLGRHAESGACYRATLRLAPDDAVALNNLGALLQAQGQIEEAEVLLRQAIAIHPKYPEAHANLAAGLQLQGRVPEAAACYRRALELSPSPRCCVQWATMLPPVYDSTEQLRQCRETLIANVEHLRQSGVRLDPAVDLIPVPFYLAFQGFNDREVQRSIGSLFVPHAGPLPAAPAGGAAKPRIGVLSKYLGNHTIGDLTRGLIEQLSRRDFHVTILAAGEHTDELVQQLRQEGDDLVSIPDNVPHARLLVAAAGLDVLFYPDVGLDPLSYTLACSRLAPVQCTTWGHPVTTGLATVDYFISSELVEPAGAEAHYTERLAKLKSLPTYYRRPVLRGAPKRRDEFGLPDEAHLYLCPQSLFKFHPDFDALLAEILRRDPVGRLVLVEGSHAHWTEMLSRRLRASLGDLFRRVTFVPRTDRETFLHLLNIADVILDPMHFGGGNTSFQALGLGVPIVTLPGEFLRGRVTAACYCRMGITACIAPDAKEYVELALRLGTDATENARIRTQIRERSSALFEDAGAVRELEDFFRRSVESARMNLGRAA